MPSIDGLASVPDMIEAQLTLSYSRLTDVISSIVEQGNSHADDISEIRERLGKLAQENSSLRAEIQALKLAKGSDEDVTVALEDVKSTLSQLSEKLEANTESIAASAAANNAQMAAAEKRADEQQVAMRATFDRHAEALGKRVSAAEKLLHTLQAFADLWGAGPEQVLEMGRRTDKQEIEYSLEDRTRYVLSLPPFAKLQEEMEVLRALLQRQAADALVAKTSEAARKNRTASYVAAMAASTEEVDHLDKMEALTHAVCSLEQNVESVQQQRLPPLESAVRSLQGRANSEERSGGTEKDLSRLHGQVAQLEDRLNFLLGQTGEAKEGDAVKAHLGFSDLARRVSLLEGTVEGFPHRKQSTPASANSATRCEAVNADGTAAAVPAHPTSRNRGSIPVTGRPPSGRLGSSGVLPPLTKEAPSSSSSTVVEGGAVSPPTRRASSLRHIPNSSDLGQPTVEVLRRQEGSQLTIASDGKRISVAVEPDGGLRRRVVELEESTAILEVNKADRKELLALEEALRNVIEVSQQLREQHQQLPLPQQTLAPNSVCNSPPLLPQRLASANTRYTVSDYATNQQRGDSLNRSTSAAAALGRPMFVGSSSSVYLRDGGKFTNVTVSPTQAPQQ